MIGGILTRETKRPLKEPSINPIAKEMSRMTIMGILG
jgi:hypothetical protein